MKKELMEKIAKKSYKKAMKSAMKVSQRGIYQLKEPAASYSCNGYVDIN